MTKLAEQLSALLEYRNRPDDVVEPLRSNWSLVPSSINASTEEVSDFSFERHLRVTPSVQEIMRQVASGKITYGKVATNTKGEPLSKRAPIIGIGNLKFSDGTQTEKSHKRGPDGDVVQTDRVLPPGAMLNTREKAETPAGGKGYTDADLHNSDLYHAAMLETDPPRFIKRGERKNGRSMSQAESRKMLDDAIANTKVMPEIKRFPKALPCGSDRVADSFIGFRMTGRGQSGSVAWEDIAQTIENAKVWRNLRRALKSEDIEVLDAAMQAQNYADLDFTEAGVHRRTTQRRGKRSLIAANDNLSSILKKSAA